jgi:hypothetical protein
MRLFAVWKVNNPGHRPGTPRESKENLLPILEQQRPAFRSKSAVLLMGIAFNLC